MLLLASTATNAAWAVWELPAGDDSLTGVKIELSISQENEAWVGFSDYSTGTWTFDGPITESQTFTLNDSTSLSPANNAYMAVLTAGGNLLFVNKVTLTVEATGWQTVTADSDGEVGQFSSLAIIDGNPAICYWKYVFFQKGELKYVRSSTPTGDSADDWLLIPITVDNTGMPGVECHMAVIGGKPAISHCNPPSEDFRYTVATTSSGTHSSDWG